jgi:hypothetical protein
MIVAKAAECALKNAPRAPTVGEQRTCVVRPAARRLLRATRRRPDVLTRGADGTRFFGIARLSIALYINCLLFCAKSGRPFETNKPNDAEPVGPDVPGVYEFP